MLLASFTLTTPTAAGFGNDAAAALMAIAGVSDVLIGDVADTCSVVYDEAALGVAQLQAALRGAGYAAAPVVAAARGASCCGSCG